MNDNKPLVTVLTPVYNGDKYLAECIESVLSQEYGNWEYFIVNNCSSDKTLEIASHYAKAESRIRVVTNKRFVDVITNHNISFNMLSPNSVYCKVVSADDVITPDCLKKMIQVASSHRSVGIVGSYQLRGKEVKWKGLPPHVTVISGREACRLSILENAQIFGNPTSELYRSELIKRNSPFYPHLLPYADISACYKYLKEWDFGFVHAVLSTERIHNEQVSSMVRAISMDNYACLDNFIRYGMYYLTAEEYDNEKKIRMDLYHRWLGGCLLKMKGMEFWKYQNQALKELGTPIAWTKVLQGAMDEIRDEIKNPNIAIRKLLRIFNKG